MPVVAIEHGEEVLGEVVLVARIQRADDAEVHGRIARLRRVVGQHEDVARVHVGMEEVVPEHLREEDLDAILGQALEVRAHFAQPVDVADRHAVDALHHHHVGAAVRSQCTSGTCSCGSPSKLRLSCAALAASRIRSSSSRMVFSYSRTTSTGRRRRPSAECRCAVRGQRVQHFEVARDDARACRAAGP